MEEAIGPFQRWADLLPEPMLLASAGDGTVLAANRMVEKLGLDPHALPGRPLAALAAEEPDAIARYLRDCSRSRQLVLGSLTVLDGGRGISCRSEGAVYEPRRGEEAAIVLLRLLPRQSSAGQFLALNERIEQLNREIARRRRAEEELARQREWLRVTLESIGDAVIATDLATRVVFANPAARALTGWAEADPAGELLAEVFRIINEETRLPAESPVSRVLREGVLAGLANHTVLIARDGREIPIDDCASPIRSGDGHILGAVMVFRDVVERRRLERQIRERTERLVETDRRKDEFLAMLAHELRNPLAPIRNGLAILDMPQAGPDAQRRAREAIDRQVQRMVRLVDDLLDVARITRGTLPLRRETVDLGALAAGAAEAVGPLMAEQGVELHLALPHRPLLLFADPLRLEQVIGNLLDNAAKFTPTGGRAWLAVSREANEAVVRVRDTGNGIPADLLAVVFEPFTQADRSLDRAHGGLGIGLTLVRRLVEAHGGTVAAASDGPGRGSELTVRLPLAGDGADRPPAPSPPESL